MIAVPNTLGFKLLTAWTVLPIEWCSPHEGQLFNKKASKHY